MEAVCRYPSPLGDLVLTADGQGLTGLRFEGQRGAPDLPAAGPGEAPPVFAEALRWLDLYFSGRAPDFTPNLRLRGTPFQREVWALLLTIPYGETVTYGALARQIAENRGLPRMSAQAVGAAAGRNPVALIVPCHRVLGARGSLTGYAGGLERKRRLLEMEAGSREQGRLWRNE